MAAGTAFSRMLAGGYSACGLAADGTAHCWPESAVSGGAVPGIRFESLSLGTYHVCGVAAAGGAVCWGRNDDGQLGDGTFESRAAPARVRFAD
jgi:alpha-tubulin suppressor-like RCC1 family protein